MLPQLDLYCDLMTPLSMTREAIAERARRVAAIGLRIDIRGMDRPARDPAKRAVLAARNGLGPYVEGANPRPRQGLYPTPSEPVKP